MSQVHRQPFRKATGYGQLTTVETVPVQIATDNLVCFNCKHVLDREFRVCSHSKHKGLIAFACNEQCANVAREHLAKVLGIPV
jgi:hypothetical protein